jgi:hypothetical protein
MTKEDLLPLAKQYFDADPMRTEIYGTEDKHFFNSVSDVKYYCKTNKEYFHFVKNDFQEKPKKVVKEETAKKVEEVKKQDDKKDFVAKMAEAKKAKKETNKE